MRESLENNNDPENLIKSRILESFINSEIPYKVRKSRLMENCGLPMPETDYFKKDEIDKLVERARERLSEESKPLVLRLACIPDKISLPVFYLEQEEDLNNLSKELGDFIEKEPTITSFIVQDATPKTKTKDKISGRVLFRYDKSLPTEMVVEIYKGGRSTGILNELRTSDKDYQRFEKKSGEFIKAATEIDPKTSIGTDETRRIFQQLDSYHEEIARLREVFSKSKEKKVGETPVCLEFSYRNGNLVFTDFD